MGNTASLIALFYFVAVVGIGIYLLVLVSRFVKSHQRGADALEAIARKLPSVMTDTTP